MRCLLLLALLYFLSCTNKNCLKEFEFHFPATITAGDTFAIGDTLWMRMDLPNKLLDHQTGELVDLSGFDLYFSFDINKVNATYVNTAVEDFELIERVGYFHQELGSTGTTYAHFLDKANKRLYLGVVPRKKGVFLISLGLPIKYGLAEIAEKEEDRLKIIDSPCTYQDITRYSGVRFNNGFINYDLILPYPCRQFSPTDTTTSCNKDITFLANRGGYAFVVE